MKLLLAVLLVAASATTALADDASSMADKDCKRARAAGKQCVLTFGEEEVTGKLIGRGDENIGVRGTTTFTSLIKLRRDFRVEIIKAAEDL
jgi:hypothetical protein